MLSAMLLASRALHNARRDDTFPIKRAGLVSPGNRLVNLFFTRGIRVCLPGRACRLAVLHNRALYSGSMDRATETRSMDMQMCPVFVSG